MTGTQQFLRRVSLVVSAPGGPGLDLSELHMKFVVKRGDIQTPNSMDIRIYNPSDQTVKALLQGNLRGTQPAGVIVPHSPEFSIITLQAGYQNAQFGLVFQGTIIQCRFGRENQADTYVDIRAADGDEAYNYAVINQSLAVGYNSPTQQLAAITAAMGVPGGYIGPMTSIQLPRGKVFWGMARDAARDHAKTQNSNWSLQDGQYQLVPLTTYVPGDIVVLNSATGMINWPEQTANGIHIKCLLNASIRIGRVVQIDNSSILNFQFPLDQPSQSSLGFVPRKDADGFYVVWVAEFTGDTRGQEWYTDLVCLRANPQEVPQFIQQKQAKPAPASAVVVNPYG